MTAGRARWGLVALFAVAAVVATLPAVCGLRSEFMADGAPGYGEAASGDHLQTTYRFWLVGHQLERGAAPWVDPYSFQPLVEPQTVLGGWPYGLPFWPLDALFGPVVAWNLLLLAVTFAAGLFAYLWLRELDLPPAAAALGGLAFELAPYRLLQSGGHLLGWIAVLLPLALWAYERSRRARSRRSSHRWGALTAAAVVSIPLSGQLHLALGVLPFVAAYAALRFARPAAFWAWGGALAAAVWGLVAEAVVIAGTTESEGRSLAEVAYYSASPLDVLSRWRLHGPERFVYLGWLLPVLAVVGLVLLARRRRGLAILLGLAALLPALLALGTNLPLYETLRDLFPPLRYPRVPGRFLPLANLALAALAAVAAAGAVARFQGRRARRRRPARLPAPRERGRPGQHCVRRPRGLGPGSRARAPDLPARHGPVRERVPVLHPAGAAGAADRVRTRAGGGLRLYRTVQPARLRRLAPRRPGGAGGARHPLDPLARRALPAVGDAGRVARERGAPARGARDRRWRPSGLPVGARAGRRPDRP